MFHVARLLMFGLCLWLKFSLFVAEVLTKENIAEPMRDIRRALLEADVSGFAN